MRADARLWMCVAVLSAGCASLPPVPGRGRNLRYAPEESQGLSHHRGSRDFEAGASQGGVAADGNASARGERVDAWETLLTEAGLEERDERPLPGSALTPAHANENMSEASRKYQAQVTEAPVGKVYKVQGVKFDGFKRGVLLETKGPGYARFLKDGNFRSWFRGADGMLEQAKRQFKAANGTPILWHFAEREVADAVRDMLRNEGLGAIKVVYTPLSP